MKTIIHDLVQGSPEWVEFRRTRHGASEAAAMLGMSKNMTRSQLLHYKFTGIAPEFSEWVQENILDEGHRVEAAIRSHIESLIGDDLSPVTCSLESTVLSASCDGLTLDSRVAWEHKQWNAELAASVERGIVPDTHMPQCQQVLMVTGADELIFTVSDGTPERCVSATVFPIAGWVHRIRAGWSQFNSDFSMYVPPEKTEPITASHQDSLPAISVQASGALLVVDNLQPFGVALRAFVAKIPKTPSTDQEFADTDAACKRLGEVETRLKSTEDSALASMADVEKLRRTIADLLSVARTARLASEKLVKSRKDEIREAEVKRGRDAIAAYVAAANDGLGGNYIIPCGRFADAIKGLKTLDSVRNAIDTEIASAKIETSTQATRIAENLKTINATGRDHLFADRVTLATHLPESVTAIVAQRVSEDDARIAREAKAAEERAALAIETKKAPMPDSLAIINGIEKFARDRAQPMAASMESYRDAFEAARWIASREAVITLADQLANVLDENAALTAKVIALYQASDVGLVV